MDPIRIGLVGIGRAGWGMHAPEIEKNIDKATFVAACDIIPERAEAMQKRFPGCKAYTDIDALIADPNVELVSIATRSCDHFAHAKRALLAGKDVLIEKPMSICYAQALELKSISDSGKYGRLFVRHNRRFEPNFLYVRDVIESGILGRVYRILLARDNYQRRDDWQTIAQFGGGQLLNWGPHIVDHSLRLLGADVKKFDSHLDQIAAAGDCEDHLVLTFTGENDRVVEMEISGGVALPVPEYRIYGTRGAMTIGEDNVAHLRYIDPEQKLHDIEADPGTPVQSFGATNTFKSPEVLNWIERDEKIEQCALDHIWGYLYDTIRNGAPFPITLEEAVDVIKYIDIAKRNSRFCDKWEAIQ